MRNNSSKKRKLSSGVEVLWPGSSRWTSSKLVRELRKALNGRVQAAYLFGSHADGSATRESDVDLILVTDTARAWPDRGQDFFDLYSVCKTALDLLVYTPLEWERIIANPTPLIWDARKTWKKIV